MVIYVESVLAFNFLLDYLLLFGAARVAGRTVARRRLLLGAVVGLSLIHISEPTRP